MNKIKLWLRAIRAPFYLGTIMAGFVGSALAFNEGKFNWHDKFHWLYFVASILIIAGANCGTNLINDYFDHLSTNDDINKYYTPFSGGSRVIQENLIKPKQMLLGGLISFAVVAVIGIFFVVLVNFSLIWFGLAAIILSFFYTTPPLKIGYRGFGEIIVFLICGPISVIGTYFLFTGNVTLESVLISIPIGLLIFEILFINEFPDYKADKAVNKKNLVVRMGRQKARFVFIMIIALIYLSVIIPVALGVFPLYLLLFLLTMPLAYKAISITLKKFDDEKQIIPAQANTIFLTIGSGILLSLGFLIDKLVGK